MNSDFPFKIGDIVVAKPSYTFSVQSVDYIFELEDGPVFVPKKDFYFGMKWGFDPNAFRLATELEKVLL